MASFSRLVHFISEDGQSHYGDAILPSDDTTDVSHATSAYEITGPILPMTTPPSYTITSRILPIKELLPPLDPSLIRTVRCLGLNYAAHAHETGTQPPPIFPPLFYKPITAISSPTAPIPIAYPLQPDQPNTSTLLDYEAELVIIIGSPCLNVPVAHALSHVLGYTVGNDVSHRGWQMQPGSGGQWGMGKCFDGWAPIGPAIVSPSLIPDPQSLKLGTKLNGQLRQASSTADMIYGVAEIVSKLSIGTTLLPGDVIFTGTPSGVALGRQNPTSSHANPFFMKDGDVVEVFLENVGSCINRVEFQDKVDGVGDDGESVKGGRGRA